MAMRLRRLGEIALGLSIFVGGPQPALGQTTTSLNYDPMLHELTEKSAVGGHGDIAKAFGPIAAIGEVGANHFNQATVITLAPGVRYALEHGSRSTISPAVQLLVGLWHCGACEVNASFAQPGLVVDYGRSPSMKIRFQFDVRRIFFDFGGETAERVSVGVVWALK